MMSGNVGGLGERFVKKDPITGETLKINMVDTKDIGDVRGDGEGSNLLPPVIAQVTKHNGTRSKQGT